MDIEQLIMRSYPLPPLSMRRLLDCLVKTEYAKGQVVIEMGNVEKNIFFLSKGIVRAYTLVDGKEVTFWIGREGDTVLSMNGYVNGEPGYETIEPMEDTVFYMLSHGDLQSLFDEDISIANWGRKFAEAELLKTEQRLISFLLATASERYQRLIENDPDILRRMPLGSIASYLGITQVSLSRIRAKVK